MDRRILLKLLLSSAIAEAADWEMLLWVPKSIVTVPQMCRDIRIIQDRFVTNRDDWFLLEVEGDPKDQRLVIPQWPDTQ